MSKTKTAVAKVFLRRFGQSWQEVDTRLVPIHLTRKDDWGNKWYYFNIPMPKDGDFETGKWKCKFQENPNTPGRFNQPPYVFTKSRSGKWQGNVDIQGTDFMMHAKVVSLDFAEVSHA